MEIVSQLLINISEAEPAETYHNTLALLILPGILQRLRVFKSNPGVDHGGRLETALDMLKRVAEAEDTAGEILGTARRHQRRLATNAAAEAAENRRQGGVYSTASLQRKVAVECGIGRYSKATRTADTLEDTYDRASRGLDPPPIVRMSATQAAGIVQHLYPDSTAEDVLPLIEPDQEYVRVTPLQVKQAILTLNRDKAPGCSAWSNTLLRSIGTYGSPEEQMQFATRLAVVFNGILSGTAPGRVRSLWTDSKIALIAKDTPGEYRPLGIGETFFRLLGKTVQSSIGRDVGLQLQPLQLAIGVSGGVEIAAMATALRSSYTQEQHTPGGLRHTEYRSN